MWQKLIPDALRAMIEVQAECVVVVWKTQRSLRLQADHLLFLLYEASGIPSALFPRVQMSSILIRRRKARLRELAKVKAGADRAPASRCPHRGREI